RVRDLATGADRDDVVPDVYYGLAWANDDRTVFYTRLDDAMRPWQVRRHTLGSAPGSDSLVFEEPDEPFYASVGRARTCRPVVVASASKTTSEVWLIDADSPTDDPVVVAPREPGHEYHVDHHVDASGDRLFVLTNAGGAPNFSVMVTPRATPGRAHWTEVL